MQIISNFTDYYDSMLQHGVDKNITFKRISKNGFKVTKGSDWQVGEGDNEALDKNSEEWLRRHFKSKLKHESDTELFSAYEQIRVKVNETSYQPFKVEVVHAVINGQVFVSYMLLENKRLKQSSSWQDEFKIIKKNASSKELFDYLKEQQKNKENKEYAQYEFRWNYNQVKDCKTYEEWISKNNRYHGRYQEKNEVNEEEQCIKLHKKLETPVFFIWRGKAYKDLPLAYFGLTDVFDNNVERTYQEIAYCLSNVVLNKNEPPLEISNNDKIQQHGFDKKKSFRHRK